MAWLVLLWIPCCAPQSQLFWKFLIALEGQGNVFSRSVVTGKEEWRDDCCRKPCAMFWNCAGCFYLHLPSTKNFTADFTWIYFLGELAWSWECINIGEIRMCWVQSSLSVQVTPKSHGELSCSSCLFCFACLEVVGVHTGLGPDILCKHQAFGTCSEKCNLFFSFFLFLAPVPENCKASF